MNNEQRDDKIIETHAAVMAIADKLEEVRTTVYGNGKPGLKLDVDRLKTFKKVSCWILSGITLATITVIGKLVYNHIVT